MTDDTVKGSASCLLSIEKTCGKPAAHWFTRLDDVADRKRMAQVAF